METMKPRNLATQLHVLAASGIFLAVLVLFFLIVSRYNHRWDVTRDRVHSASVETAEALKRLKDEKLHVRAFFADSDPARRELEILLKELATRHPDFRYEFFDPDRSPSVARKFRVEDYRVTMVEIKGRQERFQGSREQDLTNALIRLAHPRARTVCFTGGHGEASLSNAERGGLSEWKQVLEDHQFQAKEIDLVGQGVPADCDTVVIVGPHYEIFPRELDLLQKYPLSGKGLLLLIDPMDSGEGKSFERLLEPFGIRLGEDVVVDKVSKIMGGDYLTPFVTQYAEHPITERFNVATFLPVARTVRRAEKVPEDTKVTELAFTTPGSWAETDLKNLEEGVADLDPAEDQPGPLSLMAVAETGKGRVAVVGDSDWVTNMNFRLSGNKDLLLNLLQWLVQDDRWISIRPKESRFEPLFLKGAQSAGVALFAIGLLPLAALGVGSVGLWFRRKKSA